MIVESKHSLPTQKIVVRQDARSGSEKIEKFYGRTHPLIRLGETTFEPDSIISFDLSIGDALIPEMSVVVSDETFKLRDSNFTGEDSICTVFIGNALDEHHEPIKNDYYIIDAVVDDVSGTCTISSRLDVPDLYYCQNRVFVQKSSLDVLRFIANECKLGFVTNIQQTNDVMNWVQYQPTVDFITYLRQRAFIDTNTTIEIFIDQWANLNVIDYSKAFSESNSTTFVTDSQGVLLESDKPFTISNYMYGDEEGTLTAKIDGFSPSNASGFAKVKYSSKLLVEHLNIDTLESHQHIVDSQKIGLKEFSTFTSFATPNAYDMYDFAKQYNEKYSKHLKTRDSMSIMTGTFYPQVFMYMTVPTKIYEALKIDEVDTQDENVTFDNIDENVDRDAKSLRPDILSERFSGDYVVTSIRYTYSYNGQEDNLVRQSCTLVKA